MIKKADYDALIEVTPTNALSGEPAIGYIKAALNRKKHVVTSNKGPIALAAKELRAMAKKENALLSALLISEPNFRSLVGGFRFRG